jgi:hypothetical protein
VRKVRHGPSFFISFLLQPLCTFAKWSFMPIPWPGTKESASTQAGTLLKEVVLGELCAGYMVTQNIVDAMKKWFAF